MKTLSLVCVSDWETDMRRVWKEMPSIIEWLYEQAKLQWTDPQRAALIRSMARRDG